MATIQGLTKDRMLEIEAGSIVSGQVSSNNRLLLTRHDGTVIDAGPISFEVVGINDIGDVTTTSPSLNNLLAWNGTNAWINKSANAAQVATLSQVNSAIAQAGDAYAYAGAAYSYAGNAYSYAGGAYTYADTYFAPIANATFTGTTTIPNLFGTNIYSTLQFNYTPSPATFVSAATLTQTNLISDVIIAAGTASFAFTLPTGVNLDGASFGDGYSWEWSIINTVAFTKTITASSGHTYVGNATIAVNASARFLTRKNATQSFTTYRIA